MHTVGTTVLLGGIVIALLSQLYGGIKAFKVSAVDGILCIVVPVYVLVCARKYGFYKLMIGTWFLGVGGMVVGTIILS